MGTEREECTQHMRDWMLGHLTAPAPPEQEHTGAMPDIQMLPSPAEYAHAEDPDRASEDSAASGSSASSSEQYNSPKEMPQGSGISGRALEQLGPMAAGGLRQAACRPVPVSAAQPAAESA